MVGAFEWEHAVTSADDRGEAEVEQLWLEREFQGGLRARAGLFLMPVGLVNPNHEPTAYYGVYRPDVDTKIVPSTWREIGVGLSGDTTQGLTWDIAMTTMPNLSAWDASSTEGRERGPLQSIHGEGQFAAARDLGAVGALNWRGVPWLLLGGSVVYGGVAQHQPGFAGNGSRLLMLDLHGTSISGSAFAVDYLAAEQAARLMFAGADAFDAHPATLTGAQQSQLEARGMKRWPKTLQVHSPGRRLIRRLKPNRQSPLDPCFAIRRNPAGFRFQLKPIPPDAARSGHAFHAQASPSG